MSTSTISVVQQEIGCCTVTDSRTGASQPVKEAIKASCGKCSQLCVWGFFILVLLELKETHSHSVLNRRQNRESTHSHMQHL
eukprot:SAG31_NODE_14_length_37953_cov_109.719660_25_plen_82_part_00